MIRWSPVFVLVAVVVAGCDGESARPTSPSATSTQQSRITVAGVVRDLLQRPIRDARIEVAEGPSSGLAAISDALGQFSIDAIASGDRVALIASKDGYETATVRPRVGQTVIILRDATVVNIEGGATIMLTADASCTQLPASLRTRSYAAVVTRSTTTGAVMASPSTFVGDLNGADFYQGYNKIWLMTTHDAVRFHIFSWDAFNWWLEDEHIVERVTPTSHLSVAGTATAAVSNSQSTITTELDGTLSFCAESKPGAQLQWPPTCAVPAVGCRSTHHLLTMIRR
jgi:Carboxypeptidase regulatory-like domain